MPSFTCSNALKSFLFLSTVLLPVSAHLHFRPSSVKVNNDIKVDAVNAAPLPAQTASISLEPQEPDFEFDLTYVLPQAAHTVQPLSTVPQNCMTYTTASPGSSSPPECSATMSAYSITFDDCGDPFTMCRCSDAEMTMDQAVDSFSRVPIGLRRYVGTVVILSGGSAGPHAYTLTTGDIHLFDVPEIETWIHESTHALDYGNPSSPLSASPQWLEALTTDSCVPDTYSQTNAIEDFAQMGVIKTYELTHGGQLPPGFQSNCMQNQLAYLNSLWQWNATYLFGNTCDMKDVSASENFNVGAKHITAPASLQPIQYPLPYTQDPTPTPSGFLRKPSATGNFGGGAAPTLEAAGTDPGEKKSSAPRAVVVSCSMAALITLTTSIVFSAQWL